MATKKKVAVKATAKKTATKKPAPKAPAKSVKKAASVKKSAKPSKPAPKAPAKAVKKPVPAKKAAKPTPSKQVVKKAPAKPVKAVKQAPKSAVKKVAPKAPAAPIKKVATPAPKQAIKKAAPKAPAVPVKKVAVPAPKAPAAKTTVAKPTPQKTTVTKSSGIIATAKNPKDIKIPAAKPVSIPKLNTKSAKEYKPEFVKSVLDSKKSDPGAPLVRYSDNELREFKDIILRKLESAKKELVYLQGLISRKDDMGGDDSENRYMTMEDGSLSMEREQLGQMASRQITFIDHLEKALMRIENKTYGVCRVTGKLIDKARLKAVPHATLSIEAKMGIVK
jgi:RNA polymerase-binding transcription factor DksA